MKLKSYKNNQWKQIYNGCNRWFIRFFKNHNLPVFILLVVVTAFLCVTAFPVAATLETQHIATLGVSIQNPTAQTQDLLQQGKVLYEAGQFAEAVKVLQQAVKSFGSQGNELQQAVALSNLALAYQKLDNLPPAQQAITDSLKLLEKSSNSQNLQVLAPILDIQGSIQLDLGQAEQALNTWQRAESSYKQLGDRNGIIRDRINQAQAWQVLGFYRRALTILTQLQEELQSKPNSVSKAVELRSFGNALQLAGDLNQSRQVLQQSLSIAQKLNSPQDVSAALFSLGNTAQVQQDFKGAIEFYQQAAAIAPHPISKVQAQVNQLNLLVNAGQTAAVQTLLPQIQTQLAQLPASVTTIYAQINLAQSLMKFGTTPEAIAQICARALQQAENLADKRAESFALGTLGSVYEQTKQWSIAQNLTQQALNIAQTINAPDIAYRWHWQLGRLLKQQRDIEGAIASYDTAIGELQTLRSDLVVVNRDVQFSFKESVEPVYRESVELLLQFQQTHPSEPILDKARQRIEALQLAELDDFFREACINAKTVLLDTVVDKDNPTAAIIYPIILPDRLQVIVKIPKQPLRNYTVNKSQNEVEGTIKQLREYLLEPDRTEEVQALSQEVYGWLIKEIESDLKDRGVKTLVFVLDGILRNVPMAILYDGQQYLVEKYSVALSLGLQLLALKPLTQTKLNVLAAGLMQPPQNFQQQFPPLPEIKSEFDSISQAIASTTQLLDRDFNSKNLESKVNTVPFNVLHLATHGQFSSNVENTFILANDGPINVTQFDSLLRRRDRTRSEALEMLVLSACQTATGDNRATLGLAGASVKAGARSTLASLWHISDKSTAILIGEFYRELVKNEVTKAEALRRAQVKLLKDYPNYSRPGYWAPYVLVGNWL
ncbi:MAG: CHAT domain-containing protein [Nostoc sp. DedSLP03]|uniref:CHAT domain-containing protein n=1 Tax=Nostoc sp. DedSLP03 TaxID=3075400 RepID=UPI002AD2AFF5|nr:CHAT domain-containing protein [Nostoc sp. DedSLP03]MDZ7968294.1 CHAT domain-containing protein [Nostoc sp. DedSLP03]